MSQRPSGCVALGRALRTARVVSGLTQDNVAFLMDTYKSRIAQWENAHRAITSKHLARLETVLGIRVGGINRRAHSAHHEPICRADLAEGPFRITRRLTGKQLYPTAGAGE